MGTRAEIKDMAELIIRTHDGRAYFNFTKASEITGVAYSRIAYQLYNAGVQSKKVGKGKFISAYDLAEFMCKDRIAPIDND